MMPMYNSLVSSFLVAQVEGASLVWQALKHGGPASVALILFVAWWLERRDHKLEREANRELQGRLMEMTKAVTEHMVKSEAALRAVNDSMNQIITSLL